MKKTYKLLVNDDLFYEGTSLLALIRTLVVLAKKGSTVEIFERTGARWMLVDKAVWMEFIIVAG